MSKLEAIEGEIRALSREEAERLADWLSDFLEEDQEVGPGFAASIERGKADLAAGRSRVREDQSGKQGE